MNRTYGFVTHSRVRFLLTEYHQMQNHGEDPEIPTEAKSSEQRVIFINQAQPRKYTQNRIW